MVSPGPHKQCSKRTALGDITNVSFYIIFIRYILLSIFSSFVDFEAIKLYLNLMVCNENCKPMHLGYPIF